MANARISELIQRAPDGTEFLEVIIPPFTPGTNRKVLLQDILDMAGAVDSVNGQTGVVVLDIANGLPAVDTTGTAISFAIPQIYGSVASPETGNITVVTTGLVKGMTQLLIHDNGTEPTYGGEIQIISGTYSTTVTNYIMLMAVSTTLVLVTISQEVV